MAETQGPLFTDADIDRQARGNAAALPYLMVAFAKACGRSPAEAAAFAGRAFAPGWEELRGQAVLAVARTMALNLASCGAEVRAVAGGDDRAEVRVAGYPTAEDAAFFGVILAEVDAFFDVFGLIGAHLGLRCEWQRAGEEVVVTVSRY